MSNSIVDYVFRALGLEYLNRTDIVQNPPVESSTAPVQESPTAPVQESSTAPVQESSTAPVEKIVQPEIEVQETESQSSSRTKEISNEVKEVQFVTKVKEAEALDTTEATSNSVTTVQEVLGDMMGDAPACPDCGHITIRNGSCYKCLNCGNSLGCS